MAKKHKKFSHIHIKPMAGTHYSVHHEPAHEPNDVMAPMGDDEKHEKLFAHGERADLHKHLDSLMDAHEGAGEHGEPDEDDMPNLPTNHPMNKLKRKAI
jgi:hypothetical protein